MLNWVQLKLRYCLNSTHFLICLLFLPHLGVYHLFETSMNSYWFSSILVYVLADPDGMVRLISTKLLNWTQFGRKLAEDVEIDTKFRKSSQ